MSTDSTPVLGESSKDNKKRSLSSPIDVFDSKKSKSSMAEIQQDNMINSDSASGSHPEILPTVNIDVPDEVIKQITDVIQASIRVELPLIVSSIISGVVNGLQSKITCLEEENLKLKTQVCQLENKMDKAEQYSRRNCLRLSGIVETEGESVDDKVLHVAEAIGAEITIEEIDRSHRLGKQKDSGKPRDIIIKFTSYRSRQELFMNKKKLKDSGHEGVYLNEDLAFIRDKIFYQARQMMKDKLVLGSWTKDGTIIVKDKDNKFHRIETMEALNELRNAAH